MDTPTQKQIVKDAIASISHQYGPARMVIPVVFQGGIHDPAVQRALRFAKIPPEHHLNVSRTIAKEDLTHWITRHRLLARDMVEGIAELVDDALYDFKREVDIRHVTEALRLANHFEQALRSTGKEQFAEGGFPFKPTYRKYMNASFRFRWKDPRSK